MLIQKPLDQGDIVSIKLITGEEILGRFDSIVPWMMTTQPDITKLNKNTVIAYAPTDKEIAKAYVEATSSIKLA